jgi:hypothetical protein
MAEELESYHEGLRSMELGSYHSICDIIAAPGVTITGLYRQLQGSSFLQKSVIPTQTSLCHVAEDVSHLLSISTDM